MKHIKEAILNEALGGIEQYEGSLKEGTKLFIMIMDDSNHFTVNAFKKAKEFLSYWDYDMDQDEHRRPKDFEKALDTMEVGECIYESDFDDQLGEECIIYRVY